MGQDIILVCGPTNKSVASVDVNCGFFTSFEVVPWLVICFGDCNGATSFGIALTLPETIVRTRGCAELIQLVGVSSFAIGPADISRRAHVSINTGKARS